MKKFYATTITLDENGEAYGEPSAAKLWDDENELLSDFYANYGKVYELGKDDLPEEISEHSITYTGPDKVFAYFSESGEVEYFGVNKFDSASYYRLEELDKKDNISQAEWLEIKSLTDVYAYSNFDRGIVQLVDETFDWSAGDGQTEGVVKTYYFNIHE